MTGNQKKTIALLRSKGYGYRKIAAQMDLSINTVKSYCSRNPLDVAWVSCKNCGKKMQLTPGYKKRMFCSDSCRMIWWSNHQSEIEHRITYRHVCLFCGKEFDSLKKDAKYCCRTCFYAGRKKVSVDE